MHDDFSAISEFSKKGDGVFVICEGNFMYGNASLSYYDKKTGEVENQVFFRANGIPLGDVLQSVTIHDSLAYCVVNNSGKIYAINKDNFRFSRKITELVSPRYMRFVNSTKAYVTDMYARCIYAVDTRNFTVEKRIDINDDSGEYYRNSSEQMILCDTLMFVNCWSYDNKVLVINTKTDSLISRIEVLHQPRRMVIDKNGMIWVICDGGQANSSYHGKSGLVKIDAKNMQVVETFEFAEGSFPTTMSINKTGDTIYYVNDNVYRFSIYDEAVNTVFLENTEYRCYYGIGVDPSNSDVYVADAVDYMQSGVVYRYNAKGDLLSSFEVGIIPNGFEFK